VRRWLAAVVALPVTRVVPGDEPTDLGKRRHAATREPREIVTSMVKILLEIACATPEPRRDLRQHAPAEMLIPTTFRIPRREDRGPEALGVAVRVASERADVVGGDNAEAAARRLGPTGRRRVRFGVVARSGR
jgi:hypothetical protein